MSQLKEYIESSLKNEYDNLGIISQTAFNEITAYRHNSTGKKLLLIKSLNRNDGVFRTLKSIKSNGVLPDIYEVCVENDALYILEEYIEGSLLSDIISQSSINTDTLKNNMLSICDALKILHSNGIIHRDIKPSNIIIRNDGSACLIDLSIAKRVSDDRDNDTVNLGTIGYAPPEQFGFSQSQPTTDIYAFGVMLNEIILGTHPSVDIPKGRIGRIIKKCTATQVTKRYQSIDELKNALLQI